MKKETVIFIQVNDLAGVARVPNGVRVWARDRQGRRLVLYLDTGAIEKVVRAHRAPVRRRTKAR